MIPEAKILEAVQALQRAAPGSVIILFGSYARGEQRPDSDLDFLVVEPEVKARRAEMARLLLALRPLRIPADVLVISWARFEDLRQIPGTVYYWAGKEGRFFDVPA